MSQFRLEQHPPGTAPSENTYHPNPVNEAPGDGVDRDAPPGGTEALSMPGATSADVDKGLGKPMQGMTGRDVAAQLPGKKHTGERFHPQKRKKEETGLAAVGADPARDPVREHGWDLPEGIERGMKDGQSVAEERLPVTADELGAERK
jgi:hypothetical protein